MHERERPACAPPPLHPTTERHLQLPRLRRLIAKRAAALAFALADGSSQWRELEAMLHSYRLRRERAYFELGLSLGRSELGAHQHELVVVALRGERLDRT